MSAGMTFLRGGKREGWKEDEGFSFSATHRSKPSRCGGHSAESASVAWKKCLCLYRYIYGQRRPTPPMVGEMPYMATTRNDPQGSSIRSIPPNYIGPWALPPIPVKVRVQFRQRAAFRKIPATTPNEAPSFAWVIGARPFAWCSGSCSGSANGHRSCSGLLRCLEHAQE